MLAESLVDGKRKSPGKKKSYSKSAAENTVPMQNSSLAVIR